MVLVFGDHRLDRKRGELRRGGEPVAIGPRAFDLFAFLVRRRDRVVTKDDLLQGVCEESCAVIARLRAVTPEVIPPWDFPASAKGRAPRAGRVGSASGLE
jgi:hypothetical protein